MPWGTGFSALDGAGTGGVEGLPETVAEADDFKGAVWAHDAFLAGLSEAAAETEIPFLWFFEHAGVTLLG